MRSKHEADTRCGLAETSLHALTARFETLLADHHKLQATHDAALAGLAADLKIARFEADRSAAVYLEGQVRECAQIRFQNQY